MLFIRLVVLRSIPYLEREQQINLSGHSGISILVD